MTENSCRQFIAAQETNQFRFLQDLVLQQSHSLNKEGVDSVGERISRELADLPMSVEQIRQGSTGNHLLFRSPACAHTTASILLVGHMDTVFPTDSDFNWYREEGDKVYGPGVIDMKGGLAAAVYALKTLHHQNLLTTIPITLICNSDEEIGSPTSADLIGREARNALFGMVFECGGLNGEVVTGRKGKTGYRLQVTGRAGHAAFAGNDKGSAILEMAHKVIALENLNDPARGLVVNVGTINGGIGANTVADKADVDIDTRFLTRLDSKECSYAIDRISADCSIPHTCGTLTCTSQREPMEQSEANTSLFSIVENAARRLDIAVVPELRSGVSDANNVAAAGIPVLDGLGPIGDCDHSDREYMVRDSLPNRTLLAAEGIASAWQMFNRQSTAIA